ncbi:MAG TPA: hypothetical protein VHD38_01580 [Candidatus Paceibacterota bacterium]|nr:hypothetical protein [Candidatus Paceibacterota bacterium]
MVIQKTVDNLKDRPKDERKAVAGGIAITVIVILLIGWAVLFLRNIQNGSQAVNLDFGAQSEFNPSSVTQAQEQIHTQSQNGSTDDLTRIRDDAAASQVQNSQQLQVQQTQGQGTDGFGNPTSY